MAEEGAATRREVSEERITDTRMVAAEEVVVAAADKEVVEDLEVVAVEEVVVVEDLDMEEEVEVVVAGVDQLACALQAPVVITEEVVVALTIGGATKRLKHCSLGLVFCCNFVSERLARPLGQSPRSAELPSRSCADLCNVFLADLSADWI